MTDPSEIKKIITERFAQLPLVVQDAITSSNVQKQLRELSDTNKLHLDQWETLENQVMMTLLGVIPIDELQANIQSNVGVPEETARALTENISKIVFEPIRQELERQLEHPEAKAEVVSGVEAAATQALAQEKAPQVAPATPPAEATGEKVVRAPVSEAYKAGELSTERKSVHDDPYREPPA